jgi:glutaminyl-peptide cyclotransferase
MLQSCPRSLVLLVVIAISNGSKCSSQLETLTTPVGRTAYSYTEQLTAIGPRPPGSAGIAKAREWIKSRVQGFGVPVTSDRFLASTPLGSIEMENLSFVLRGQDSKQRVVFVAHYDSKRFIGFDFVGANDAASSVALLIALIPEIKSLTLSYDVEVVFVDGEEALDRWTAEDSLYGSRHYVSKVGDRKQILAAIVVDMIGDADLRLIRDRGVSSHLMRLLEDVLKKRGWSKLLDDVVMDVMDDHTPFIEANIPALHLMDYTFGGSASPGLYWHTAADTIDKVSVTSLSALGEILKDLLVSLR